MHIFLLKCPLWTCIYELHQLWQSGFSRVSSNLYCSCSFEPEIIKIGQSYHKMYSNKILNNQESTTILNACTKMYGNLLNTPRILTYCLDWHKIKYFGHTVKIEHTNTILITQFAKHYTTYVVQGINFYYLTQGKKERERIYQVC